MMLGNANQQNITVECADKQIPVSKEIKSFDVTLDDKLKFDSHIAEIYAVRWGAKLTFKG